MNVSGTKIYSKYLALLLIAGVFLLGGFSMVFAQEAGIDEGDLPVPPPVTEIDDGDIEIPEPTTEIDEGDIEIDVPDTDIDEGDIEVEVPDTEIDDGEMEVPNPEPGVDEGEVEVPNPDPVPEPETDIDEGDLPAEVDPTPEPETDIDEGEVEVPNPDPVPEPETEIDEGDLPVDPEPTPEPETDIDEGDLPAEVDPTPEPPAQNEDTTAPSVTVSVSDTLVNESDAGSIFVVTAVYDESMNTSVTPSFTFTPNVDSTLTNGTSSWSSDTTFTVSFTVSDSDIELADIAVRVDGGEDVAGNTSGSDIEIDAFDIDTISPVASLLYSSQDPYSGGQSVLVSVTFSELLSNTTPKIAVNTQGNGDLSPTELVATGDPLVWTLSWGVPFGIDENGNAVFLIEADDIAGNSLSTVTNNIVEIDNTPVGGGNPPVGDTTAPLVASVGVSDSVITEIDAGSVLTLTVTFNENMDQTIAPTVVFSEDISTTLSATGTPVWTSSTTYELQYDVVDADVEKGNIAVVVSDARDTSGNIMNQFTSALDTLRIDTIAPGIVLSYNPTTSPLVGSTTVVVTATVSEVLSTVPTISITTPAGIVVPLTIFDTPAVPGTSLVFTYEWAVPTGNQHSGEAELSVYATDVLGNTNVIDATNNTREIAFVGVDPTPDPDPTPPTGGGGGGGFVPVSRSTGGGNGPIVGTILSPYAPTIPETPVVTPDTSCRYQQVYLGEHLDNDPTEVAKLQAFLRGFEGEAIEITGTYGPETSAAVTRFQVKYAGDVLDPWGITEPTGYSYITTTRKINEIVCNIPVAFTEEEQRILNTYLTRTPVASTSNIESIPVETAPKEDRVPEDIKDIIPEDAIETNHLLDEIHNPLRIYDDYYILPGAVIWKTLKKDTLGSDDAIPGSLELHPDNIYIKVN